MNRTQLPAYTRRVFMERMLQTLGAAVCLSATAGILARAATPDSQSDLYVLTADEYAILDALGDALIPPGGAFQLGARDLDLARRIDSHLPVMAPAVVIGFRGALAFIDSKAPPLAAKAAPFSVLSREDRHAVLAAMLSDGGLARGILFATKYVCMVHFYSADATWKFTGYDGPMLQQGAQS